MSPTDSGGGHVIRPDGCAMPASPRAMLALATGLLVMGCSTARVDVPRPSSQAIAHPEETLLGRACVEQLAAFPDLSGFRLLVAGEEAFLARAALAEAAERTLDLQYYIVAQDASATLLLYRALRAAQRGVRVRLLIDDIYAVGRDFDLAALATHPNVQIRVFNPFTYRGPFGLSRLFEWLGDGDRLNRRMHNKLWIADNAFAVIGGRNLGDAYFNVGADNDFADLDVLAAGPAVRAMSDSFDAYWNSASAMPIGAFVDAPPGAEQLQQALSRMTANAERFRASEYAQALRDSGIGPLLRAGRLPLVAAHASVFDTGVPTPAVSTEAARPVAAAIRRLIEGAQHEAMLISPYFIPSARGVDFLCGLVKRGVHVRVLTNSLASTDVPVVHAGYARYRPDLVACGVELHEMRPRPGQAGKTRAGLSSGASLHAKAVVVDGRSVLIGSMNLDPRSRLSNSEIAVLIESPILAEELGALFDEAASPEQSFRVELAVPGDANASLAWRGSENGEPVRYEGEPLASWWRRLVAGLLGAMAPEELL